MTCFIGCLTESSFFYEYDKITFNNNLGRLQYQTRLRHKWILPDCMEKMLQENYKLN